MLILSNLLIFLIFQWSTDIQLTRTQSPELVHVNFGARFQVSHFITNHSLGWILWKDYCVSKCVSNRQQTRKISSLSSPTGALPEIQEQVSEQESCWELPLKPMKHSHSNKVFDWIQICWAQGYSQEPINIYLIWGSLDRWFINKNMAEKETIVNGMQWQLLGVSVGLS